MLEHNPIMAHQHNPAEKMAAEKSASVNNTALNQTGTDVKNKMVSPMREFPGDSAFISDEAKKAFEKQDEQKRVDDANEEMAKKWEKDALKKKKKKKQKNKNPYLKVYDHAREVEEEIEEELEEELDEELGDKPDV